MYATSSSRTAPSYLPPAGPPPQGGMAHGGGYAQDHHLDDAFDATPFGDDAAAHTPGPSPYYNERQPMPSMYYNQQPDTRPPPPSGPAPAYARILNRTFYSLRPVLLVTCFMSAIYLLILGIADFRIGTDGSVTHKLQVFEIIQGALFMAALAIEILGLYAAYSQKLPLARMYSFLSLGAYAAVLASQILGIVVVFQLKNDVIASCVTYYTTGIGSSGGWLTGVTASDSGTMSNADATDYCNSLWSRSRTWEVVWLLVAAIVGAFFVMLSFGYARQLADPSSVRVRQRTGPPTVWTAPAYDPEGAYRPGPNNPYAYPPPPHPAPMYGAGGPSPPGYEGRPSTDGYDLDAKDPTGAFAQHTEGGMYGRGGAAHAQEGEGDENERRPGSSRGMRRDSGETLQDGAIRAKTASHEDEDDHATPRI